MTEKMQIVVRGAVPATISVALLLLFASLGHAKSQSGEQPDAFTEVQASKLLKQIAEGMQGHSKKRTLSAFDLSRMDAGPLFAEQITALFAQYDSIRVHFQLVQVKDNIAVVDAEMDSTPSNNADPPQHKNVQLRFTAATTSAGWKFVDVQPRNFFT